MNPNIKDIYFLTEDGRKLHAIDIFKDKGTIMIKLNHKPEPKDPLFCGFQATMGDCRRIEFVANIKTNEVVAYAIIPDGCTKRLLHDALMEYGKIV